MSLSFNSPSIHNVDELDLVALPQLPTLERNNGNENQNPSAFQTPVNTRNNENMPPRSNPNTGDNNFTTRNIRTSLFQERRFGTELGQYSIQITRGQSEREEFKEIRQVQNSESRNYGNMSMISEDNELGGNPVVLEQGVEWSNNLRLEWVDAKELADEKGDFKLVNRETHQRLLELFPSERLNSITRMFAELNEGMMFNKKMEESVDIAIMTMGKLQKYQKKKLNMEKKYWTMSMKKNLIQKAVLEPQRLSGRYRERIERITSAQLNSPPKSFESTMKEVERPIYADKIHRIEKSDTQALECETKKKSMNFSNFLTRVVKSYEDEIIDDDQARPPRGFFEELAVKVVKLDEDGKYQKVRKTEIKEVIDKRKVHIVKAFPVHNHFPAVTW